MELALGDRASALVPPEPLAGIGGTAVRIALIRGERLEIAGRRPDPITRAICARALGIDVA